MIWLGLALLSTSWLFALGYYHAVDWIAWTGTVALGSLCMLGGPIRPRAPKAVIAGALLMCLPSLILLPQPYLTAAALVAGGLLLQLLANDASFPRWSSAFTRAAGAALSAGSILLAQSVAIRCYIGLTARSHDLPAPLAQFLGTTMQRLGMNASQYENTVSVHSMRRIHRLAATWELFFDPVTVCFVVGVITISIWFSWQALWNRRQVLIALGVLVAGLPIWLPVRSATMIALYLHDVLRTGYDAKLDSPELFWNSWVHLLLLGGPVAFCWRFLPKAADAVSASGALQAVSKISNRRAFVGSAMFLTAAALITVGTLWKPVGYRQAGRVLVDEYHPQPEKVWEPTTKPFDTTWYGTDSGYNYYCVYDYLSHFYTMSRGEAPLDATTLGRIDILVLKVPTRAYSDDELEAISDFVRRGGGLLLIGEHTNVFHTSDYLNPVARMFGFEFREDCVFGIDSFFEQEYAPPLVPHPIVQHLDWMYFATSCSIDPGYSPGDAAILDTGLKNLLADYHSNNFYPIPEDRAEMRYGAFVQLWSTQYGEGRVVAFTDSTIFSNFCVFDEGKSELMLGMIEWLNHRGPRYRYQYAWLVIGIAVLIVAIGNAYCRRLDLTLIVTASLLGTSLAIAGIRYDHRSRMPPPKPLRGFVQVNIDRTVSDSPLSRNGFVDGTDLGFGIFERWLLRLGYFTKRTANANVFDGDVVIVLRPQLTPDSSYLDQLKRYVDGGGRVLVVDSPSDRSTTNMLLATFGLSVDAADFISGMLETERQDWPVVPVSDAVVTQGGSPFAWIAGRPVGTVAQHGRGTVTLIGFANRFCDAEMGGTGDVVPDGSLQQVFELDFSLMRWIATEANVAADDAAPIASP